jgi:hypothetical protein
LDLERIKDGLARLFKTAFTLCARREATGAAEPMGKIGNTARYVVTRLQQMAQAIHEGERIAERPLPIPRICVPIEALETLASANDPTLELLPERASDSPVCSPARSLRALVAGRRN